MPANHDTTSTKPSDGTQGVTQKVNTDTGPYVSTKDGRIVVNDGDNDRIIIGLQADGTYRMKQSEAGVNVDDASFLQTTFDSTNATFQILEVVTDTVTRSPGAGALTRTINTTLEGKASDGPPSSLAYLSTYLNGTGDPTETLLAGQAGGYGLAANAQWVVKSPMIGTDYVTVTITYPANTTLSTAEYTFTVYLFTSILPYI